MNNMSSIILHSELLQISALPMLIYDYNKNFQIKTKETLKDYLHCSDCDLSELSNYRKKVLKLIETYAPNGTVEEFINDQETGLQVGITHSNTKKRICVVFRGSDSLIDWYYDLKVLKQHLKNNIYVHKGFYNQLNINDNYEKIKKSLLNLIQKYPDNEIIITGHSLGGALSVLFGYLISNQLKKTNIKVISFASPRVGNYYFKKDFDNILNLNHYRVTNNRDIVTSAPMIGYWHVGKNIHLCSNYYEYYDNYNYNLWLKYSIFNCWRISDHCIDLYYENLEKNTW